MAKQSVIQRQLKRERLVAKHAAKRAELKKVLADPKVTEEAFYAAQSKLTKLPRNGSRSRVKRRCQATGASHAVYRKFQLNRISFRNMALQGLLPGVTKASW